MSAEPPAAHVEANRRYWDGQAGWFATRARRLWAAGEPVWGNWNIPQSRLPVLPDEVAGLDTVELGCGTGYISAWLARAGARPVGLDNSARQLGTARAMQREYGVRFPLVHANAERAPFADASFDLVISEYGASVWCDPYRWIPEAARLLRPGGRLVFLCNSTLLMLCIPDDGGRAEATLRRDLFGLHRMSWPDSDSVEFHLPHGEWIRLLRGCGFVVDELIEVQSPAGGATDFDYVPPGWAARWPAEEVWKAHLPGLGAGAPL